MYSSQFSGLLLKRFNTTPNIRLSFYAPYKRQGKFDSLRKAIGVWFREQSLQVAKVCTRQFEFIAAQRIRRSIQIFHLYTRLWDEAALKEFMKSWQHRIARNAHHFLISAAGVAVYNWDHERISDEEIRRYNHEIERIYRLRESTVVCAKCHLRIMFDTIQPGVKYCECHGVKCTIALDQNPDGWEPFIEREDMLIWRREEPNSGGLFAYKVYGSFPDVTAEDFLQVQIDVDYRKEWDPTARELQIIETDPQSVTSKHHSIDIIYWEMIWPRLFANRDYVYQRRWILDKENRLIVIVSKGTNHPSVPTKAGTYRVTTYWSYMVIRPYTEFHQPGIEFGLTYFDDPGVNVPSTVTTWVAMSGLPNFLIRMRQASKDYQNYKMMKADSLSEEPVALEEGPEAETEAEVEAKASPQTTDNKDHGECSGSLEHPQSTEENDMESIEDSAQPTDSATDSPTDSPTEKEQGSLNQFFLTKLFA